MTPGQIETALNFLMSKLPENELAELDALMEGATMEPSSNLAQDSARKAWMQLGSHGRRTVRQAKQSRVAQDAANMTAFHARFPNANRLG